MHGGKCRFLFIIIIIVRFFDTPPPPYFTLCVWNGAAYYIHVFSKRYKEKFENKPETSMYVSGAGAQPRLSTPPWFYY